MSKKFTPGTKMPEFELPKVGGGTLKIGGTGGWQIAIVVRGRHCPLCKKYVAGIPEHAERLAELGASVVAFSADSEAQATEMVEDAGITVPMGYGMDEARMRELGLYISEPRPNETDHNFPEPGLFVVNPEGNVQIVDISNAPFSRPEISGILRGIGAAQDRGYPIRGTKS